MPDYRLFQKEQTVRAVNTERQDQWDVVHADNADAALLRYQQLRHEEDNAEQNFANDSVLSSLINLISR
ncbi:hypothetical protein [Pantoea agglomerans]|uniref:hypothetical protein n=1 Tax=Enterobacter agglomerans TaxID=549 RepID=UPI003C7C85BD